MRRSPILDIIGIGLKKDCHLYVLDSDDDYSVSEQRMADLIGWGINEH